MLKLIEEEMLKTKLMVIIENKKIDFENANIPIDLKEEFRLREKAATKIQKWWQMVKTTGICYYCHKYTDQLRNGYCVTPYCYGYNRCYLNVQIGNDLQNFRQMRALDLTLKQTKKIMHNIHKEIRTPSTFGLYRDCRENGNYARFFRCEDEDGNYLDWDQYFEKFGSDKLKRLFFLDKKN